MDGHRKEHNAFNSTEKSSLQKDYTAKKEKALAVELLWLYLPKNSITLVRDCIQFN